MLVSDWMRRSPVAVNPGTPVATALRIVDSTAVRWLPVVGQGRLLGVASDVEIRGWAGLEANTDDPDAASAPIGDRVAPPLATVEPGNTLEHAAAVMHRHRLSCLGVTADTRLVGLLTAPDLLCALARALPVEAAGTSLLALPAGEPRCLWMLVRALTARDLVVRALLHVPRAGGERAAVLLVTRGQAAPASAPVRCEAP